MMVSRDQRHGWLREGWTERDCAEAGIDCDSGITAVSKWSCVSLSL